MSAPDFASLTHTNYGKPLRWWHYGPTFAVAAFRDSRGRKLTLSAIRNGAHCYWHEPLPPLPLYGAPELEQRPDAPVLLFESEAVADAAAPLFPDHVCLAWPLGCNAVNKAGIAPLAGRDVVLWHGSDGAIITAMARMEVRLKASARSIVRIAAPRAWRVTWDYDERPPSRAEVEDLQRTLRQATAGRLPSPTAAVAPISPAAPVPDPLPQPQPAHVVAMPRAADDGDTPPLMGPPRVEAPVVDPLPLDGVAQDATAEAVPPAPAARQAVAAGVAFDQGQPLVPDAANDPGVTAGSVADLHTAAAAPPPANVAHQVSDGPVDRWLHPDLSLLDTRRGSLPGFPLEVLPPFWRDWCRRVIPVADASIDYVAPALLTVAAGLIGGARWIAAVQARAEPCTLWTALVGAPGSGRTSGMRPALQLMRGLQDDPPPGRPATARQAARLEAQRAHHERVLAQVRWERARAEAAKRGEAPPPQPSAPLAAPGPRALVIDEPRIEALAAALQLNPRGVLLAPDSLAGWLGAPGHSPRAAAERRARLRSWSGRPWTVDDSGWVGSHAPYAGVSVLGTVDPDSLAATLEHDADMAARLLFAWPERSARPLDDAAPATPCPEALAALGRLRAMPDAPRIVPLSSDARLSYGHFRERHNSLGDELDGAEAAWWGKGTRVALRLAGILTFLDWAAQPDGTPEPAEVGGTTARNAVNLWRDHLWPHAQAVFRAGWDNGDRYRGHARTVLRWLANQRQGEVSREEIRRNALRQRVKAAAADNIAAMLVEGGWFREVKHEPVGPGAPRHRWLVNQALWQDRLIHARVLGIGRLGQGLPAGSNLAQPPG